MKRILVALDGSSESEQVLQEIARLGTRETAIDLIHVVEDPHHEVPDVGAEVEDLAEDYLRRAAASIKGRAVQIHLWRGRPEEEIPRAAERLHADLIALSTHARKGLSHLFLGSVASAVVRNATIPVLLTRPGMPRPRRGLERILVPVDRSDPTLPILGPVRTLAAYTGAEVVLLQVVTPLIVGDPVTGFTPLGVPDPLPDPGPALDALARELTKEGVLARGVVVHGDPAERILEQAKDLRADLIAMGTSGRKGLSRLMLGSVAEAVVRHMDRAILLQRTPTPAELSARAHGSHDQGAE